MTLTELRYIVALAQHRHFGRAANACFVSQPTLSIAVRKLEDELGIPLFERRRNEVSLTETGARVIAQAQRVLEEAEELKRLARSGFDELASPLTLGAIYTVGPYLLPHLIPRLHETAPQMGIVLREGYTHELIEALRSGILDVVILSLPLSEPALQTELLYQEPFMVAMPADHAWAALDRIQPDALSGTGDVLLLSSGNCFRDQVLQACPHCNEGPREGSLSQSLEGSSLETIRHMVASGLGITVLPASAVGPGASLNGLLEFRPFVEPAPSREIALVWRSSFTRLSAVRAVADAVKACSLPWMRAPAASNAAKGSTRNGLREAS
jgi:LysR family transcriptional regulator, hydrogen peroxide-inducible genes activator